MFRKKNKENNSSRLKLAFIEGTPGRYTKRDAPPFVPGHLSHVIHPRSKLKFGLKKRSQSAEPNRLHDVTGNKQRSLSPANLNRIPSDKTNRLQSVNAPTGGHALTNHDNNNTRSSQINVQMLLPASRYSVADVVRRESMLSLHQNARLVHAMSVPNVGLQISSSQLQPPYAGFQSNNPQNNFRESNQSPLQSYNEIPSLERMLVVDGGSPSDVHAYTRSSQCAIPSIEFEAPTNDQSGRGIAFSQSYVQLSHAGSQMGNEFHKSKSASYLSPPLTPAVSMQWHVANNNAVNDIGPNGAPCNYYSGSETASKPLVASLEEIPDWLCIYLKTDASKDHLLKWDMFTLPQLDYFDECMRKLFRDDMFAIIRKYESIRQNANAELEKRVQSVLKMASSSSSNERSRKSTAQPRSMDSSYAFVDKL